MSNEETGIQIAMLSAQDVKLEEIRLPAWVSTKFDGIRCLTVGGKPMSRSNTLLPNLFLQSKIAATPTWLDKLDGELIIGEPDDPDCYNTTQSGIMSIEGEPAFRYYVFDDLSDPSLPFYARQDRLKQRFMEGNLPEWCVLVKQWYIESHDQLIRLYEWLVDQGHEGVITRNPLSPYEAKRGTKKNQTMVKLKPREDSEMRVTGFVELQRNTNKAKLSNTGRTKRSSAKAGKVAGGTLGKILGVDIHTGQDVKLGTFKGLKNKDKQYIWDHQEEFLDRIAVYSFCPVGVKKLPRQASWKGWRTEADL